jgi:hypothetical protein
MSMRETRIDFQEKKNTTNDETILGRKLRKLFHVVELLFISHFPETITAIFKAF